MDMLTIRRDRLKVTQAKLAEIAGVNQSTVSRWERGELEPSIGEVRRIIDWAAAQVPPVDVTTAFFGEAA